jgi:hypothetical protein
MDTTLILPFQFTRFLVSIWLFKQTLIVDPRLPNLRTTAATQTAISIPVISMIPISTDLLYASLLTGLSNPSRKFVSPTLVNLLATQKAMMRGMVAQIRTVKTTAQK